MSGHRGSLSTTDFTQANPELIRSKALSEKHATVIKSRQLTPEITTLIFINLFNIHLHSYGLLVNASGPGHQLTHIETVIKSLSGGHSGGA